MNFLRRHTIVLGILLSVIVFLPAKVFAGDAGLNEECFQENDCSSGFICDFSGGGGGTCQIPDNNTGTSFNPGNATNGTGGNATNGTGGNATNGTGGNATNGTGGNATNGTGGNATNGTGNSGSTTRPPNRSLLLVTCTDNTHPIIGKDGKIAQININGTLYPEYECNFKDVVAEIKLLINFFFILSVPVTVIAITYTGIQILLAQGNTKKLGDARGKLTKVVIGFVIILSAWLIVHAITSLLLRPEFYTPFLGS